MCGCVQACARVCARWRVRIGVCFEFTFQKWIGNKKEKQEGVIRKERNVYKHKSNIQIST